MDHKKTCCVPTLTTKAGSTLTAQNWHDAHIHVASCAVDALLLKPGLEFLLTLPSLNHYFAWQGALVLNASMLVVDKDGNYTIKSPFDGACLTVSTQDIVQLVQVLKPKYLILPQDSGYLWKSLPPCVFPFVSYQEASKSDLAKPYGVYFDFKEPEYASIGKFITQFKDVPLYITGELKWEHIREFAKLGAAFVQCDIPLQQAFDGTVHTRGEIMSITSQDLVFDFEPIDNSCHCPTCQLKLTKAYLSHLFTHTPLLCQRFLIQHNMYYCQNSLSS